jgi:hypothetical protein
LNFSVISPKSLASPSKPLALTFVLVSLKEEPADTTVLLDTFSNSCLILFFNSSLFSISFFIFEISLVLLSEFVKEESLSP